MVKLEIQLGHVKVGLGHLDGRAGLVAVAADQVELFLADHLLVDRLRGPLVVELDPAEVRLRLVQSWPRSRSTSAW